MMALFGAGYANFRDFSRRKTMESAVNQLVSDITLTKEYALAGKRPSTGSCNHNPGTNLIRGYRLNFGSSSTDYNIEVDCTNHTNSQKSGSLSSYGVTVSSMNVMSDCGGGGSSSAIDFAYFKSLGHGLDIPLAGCIEIVLIQTHTSNSTRIRVGQTGNITITNL